MLGLIVGLVVTWVVVIPLAVLVAAEIGSRRLAARRRRSGADESAAVLAYPQVGGAATAASRSAAVL